MDAYAINPEMQISSSIGSNIISGMTFGAVKKLNYTVAFSGGYRANHFTAYCHMNISLKKEEVHLHKCFLRYSNEQLKLRPPPHPRTSTRGSLEEAGIGKVPVQCE